jgi:hypothetical protein
MAQKVHYIYHWNHIFGALTALVLLICLVSYGVYSLVETENLLEPPETPLPASNNKAAPKEPSLPQNEVNPSALTDRKPLPRSPGISDAGGSQQQSNKHSIESTPLPLTVFVEERLPVIEVESDPPPVEASIKLPDALSAMEALDTQTDRPSLSEKPQPSQQKDPVLAALQPEQSESNRTAPPGDSGADKTFHLLEINRFSPSVKRFTLARSIIEREPVGSIDSITTDTKGVAVIYAFSEVINMRDRTLYYHWFSNEKPVAKVRVGIGADSWRSYSSKYINEKMKGSWVVELRTADGQKLASAKFFAGTPSM